MKKGVLLLFLVIRSISFAVGDDTNIKLYHAALFCDIDIVRELLDQGLDVNAVLESDSALNVIAGDQSGYKTLKLLINRGINVDHQNQNGESALFAAVSANNSVNMKLLLESGANIDLINKFRFSALTRACVVYNLGIINVLLQKNAKFRFHIAEISCLVRLINKIIDHEACDIEVKNVILIASQIAKEFALSFGFSGFNEIMPREIIIEHLLPNYLKSKGLQEYIYNEFNSDQIDARNFVELIANSYERLENRVDEFREEKPYLDWLKLLKDA